jgi:hypothetical protein
MKINVKSANEIAISIRRNWGELNPCTRVYKSKKHYNRKDKSWKKEYTNG